VVLATELVEPDTFVEAGDDVEDDDAAPPWPFIPLLQPNAQSSMNPAHTISRIANSSMKRRRSFHPRGAARW
jgi:hypothetical protein